MSPRKHPVSPVHDPFRHGLLTRLLDESPALSAEAVARIALEVPSFAALPDDVLQLEIRSAVLESLRLVLRSLIEGRDIDFEHLAMPLRNAMARVEHRLAFADILGAYFVGARVGWQRLLEHARPEDAPVLLGIVEPLARQLQRLSVAAAEAYSDEQRLVHGESGEARRDLIAALLVGVPAGALAERAGIQLAAGYLVLRWDAEPAEDEPRATALARRRVRGALDDRFGATVLTTLDEYGGTALIPSGDSGRAEMLVVVRSFVAELTGIVGARATAAAGIADTSDGVPAAADEAEQVLDVALRLRRPAGLYLLDDLLLEVQLARPGIAADRLVQRVDPLLSRPDLLATLRVFLHAKHNRRRAAAALHVHPNTVDYRLRRIAEVTGLDPTEPDAMRILTAGITAHELRARCGPVGERTVGCTEDPA